MPRYVALLRSVNVAGHGRLAMSELRASFERLSYDDVSTYIQTGNVLFSSSTRSEQAVATAIEEQMDADFGDAPAVIVRVRPRAPAHRRRQPLRQGGGQPGTPPRDVPRLGADQKSLVRTRPAGERA